MHFFTIFIVLLLAITPAFLWIYLFNKENIEWKFPIIFAVIWWWLSTIPVIFYQRLWWKEGNFVFFKIEAINFQDNISQLFWANNFSALSGSFDWSFFSMVVLSIFSVFLWVWLLEEFFKHVLINPRLTWFLWLIWILWIWWLFLSWKGWIYSFLWMIAYLAFLFYMPKFIKLKTIDDAISFAIIWAIWFSLVENILYFYNYLSSTWIFSIFELSTWEIYWFLWFVIIRVSVVTMVHILCSWIFGYHFWLSHFAHPELELEIREWRKHPILDFLHKIFKTSEDKIFMYEQLFLALFISITVHWVYDLVAQLNFLLFWKIPLMAIVMPLYFIWWFFYLFSLLEEKRNRVRFWQLVIKKEYV